MKQLIPDNLVGDPSKLPSEMVKLVPGYSGSKSSSTNQSTKKTGKSIVKKEEDKLLQTSKSDE